MKINIRWPWELSPELPGIAVVIDVNAATTNLPLLLYHQVKKLLIVNEESVLRLKKKIHDALIIGESRTLPENTFDSNNFPFEIQKLNLRDKTILYMSNNGSRVIEKVFKFGAQTILTAGFVNFQSVINWLSENQSQPLTLIPAGEIIFPDRKSYEDYYCAQAIKNMLEKRGKVFELMNRARKFVSRKYDPYIKDIEKNLQIEFNLNKFPLIPLCNFYKDNEIIVDKL